MSGYDPKDSTSLNVKQIDFQTNLNESIKDLNIGLPKEFFDAELPSYLQKSIEESVDVYKILEQILLRYPCQM